MIKTLELIPQLLLSVPQSVSMLAFLRILILMDLKAATPSQRSGVISWKSMSPAMLLARYNLAKEDQKLTGSKNKKYDKLLYKFIKII